MRGQGGLREGSEKGLRGTEGWQGWQCRRCGGCCYYPPAALSSTVCGALRVFPAIIYCTQQPALTTCPPPSPPGRIIIDTDSHGEVMASVTSSTHERKSKTNIVMSKSKMYLKHNAFV